MLTAIMFTQAYPLSFLNYRLNLKTLKLHTWAIANWRNRVYLIVCTSCCTEHATYELRSRRYFESLSMGAAGFFSKRGHFFPRKKVDDLFSSSPSEHRRWPYMLMNNTFYNISRGKCSPCPASGRLCHRWSPCSLYAAERTAEWMSEERNS